MIDTRDEDTYLYSERQIAELLPTLWDELARNNPSVKPNDPEMPKGPAPDPSHSGDHMAHVADISRAWKLAPLTLRQKQVLLMRYGMAWTQQDCADYYGITRPRISESETAAIANIKNFLNGTDREDCKAL